MKSDEQVETGFCLPSSGEKWKSIFPPTHTLKHLLLPFEFVWRDVSWWQLWWMMPCKTKRKHFKANMTARSELLTIRLLAGATNLHWRWFCIFAKEGIMVIGILIQLQKLMVSILRPKFIKWAWKGKCIYVFSLMYIAKAKRLVSILQINVCNNTFKAKNRTPTIFF